MTSVREQLAAAPSAVRRGPLWFIVWSDAPAAVWAWRG
jgi:hypothetical protein